MMFMENCRVLIIIVNVSELHILGVFQSNMILELKETRHKSYLKCRIKRCNVAELNNL
jgi:hypothetical protein